MAVGSACLVTLLTCSGARADAYTGTSGMRSSGQDRPDVVSADLTPDGFDRYEFIHTESEPRTGDDRSNVAVSARTANQHGNLRTVWWMDGQRPTVDQESCVTWSEYSGPIVQAGVALRVRKVGDHTQAITVTNNIMWGARNGWNLHLWNGGTHGDLIGQAVLSHSFGTSTFNQPPLPWRLCARVVGTTLEFKAWSLATNPVEPDWSDPGFGTSFGLPKGWVYPGQAGWYVGHLRPGDSTVFRSLRSGVMRVGSLDRVSIVTHTVADRLKRQAAATLVVGLQSAAV
jgi:hypothetical protein